MKEKNLYLYILISGSFYAIVYSDTIKNRARQQCMATVKCLSFLGNNILESLGSINNSIQFLIWLGSQFL